MTFSPISANIRFWAFVADKDMGKWTSLDVIARLQVQVQAPHSKLMLRGPAIVMNIQNIHTF